ncbi:MAG: NAD-dependent epimerase/dehydratase family protein [Butyrivibrio sp.]|nr:NAD-dependent epimerase/dehydratase family protein [Butyrivibrio sp.]
MNQQILESPADKYLQEDLENIADSTIPVEELKGSSILVTGATGLVGSQMVRSLACINRKKRTDIRILALVRSSEKAREIFGDLLDRGDIELILADLQDPLCVEESVDFIIHGAAVTASKLMVSKPVETIRTAISGTENILKLALTKKVKSMVYLSSMEVYGTWDGCGVVTEDKMGYVNPLVVRSNYPESKRMCENMCIAYLSEYHVPVRIARLAQTFGAGILPGENRVFAQFARSAMNGADIVLHTTGQSEGNYCYTADTIRAILTILVSGKDGEAYNISNEETHTTIAEMAEFAAEKLANGKIKVVFEIPEKNTFGYAADTKMKLSSAKMRSLGWKPYYSLEDCYRRMMGSMRETEK